MWCRLNSPHHPDDHPPSWLHDYHPDPLRKITNYKQWGCENMLKNMSSHSTLRHTKCHTPAACSLRCESVASKENKQQGRNIPVPFRDTCCPSPGPPSPTRSPTPPPSPPPPCSPSPRPSPRPSPPPPPSRICLSKMYLSRNYLVRMCLIRLSVELVIWVLCNLATGNMCEEVGYMY